MILNVFYGCEYIKFKMAYQRQNWQATDSGILRKKEENEEELLVFGYSCKLFRDDEKALYVDQGKHLIPWMGDESLRIDRYDVRGALYDVSQYEAISSGQQEELFWVNLSNDERRIEQLCDEERYRALTHNEDEERLYQEEELKRLHQALGSDKTYGQVSYSYDEENGETEKPVAENQMEDDEPFVAPVELDLPQDIIVPETVKSNAIIEKTALFINQQGSQMEIILKMKQATNPQFEFLSYRSPLHAYYRHVLGALKSGRYKPKILSANSADNNTEDENASNNQNYYLHHTLSQVPTTSVDVAPVIPSINYKPSSDCAYSMLVNKIRNNQNKMSLLSQTNIDIVDKSSETITMREDINPDIVSSPVIYNPLEPVDDATVDNDVESGVNPSSPSVPLQRPNRRKRRKRQQGAFAYNDMADTDSLDGTEMTQPVVEADMVDEFVENVDAPEEEYEVPPTDLQLIIDKMACYVGKNGRDFEEIVKAKGDPRFSFLDVSNPYYVYYRKKVEFFEQSQKPVDDSGVDGVREGNVNSNCSEKDDGEDSMHVSQLSDGSGKGSAAGKPSPVCFSIKRPKETESLEIKSALPVEESSDEDNEENEDGKVCVNENVVSGENNGTEQQVESTNVACKSSSRHTTQEKRIEERGKENVSTKDKEKLLQLERKKRAAAFLNLIQKSKMTSENAEAVMIGPQLPDELKADKLESTSGDDEDMNDGSVSSPPSSVTSPDLTVATESMTNPTTSPKVRKHHSPKRLKAKRAKYLTPEKYAMSRRHVKVRDGVEYKHKHRKRKRSRTPTRKHYPHSDRSHLHRSGKESKHRKHHRHHRKEWRHDSSREYTNSEGVHRRHKHYKLKKHKRKEDKKYSSKSNSSNDSDSN